MTLCHFLPSFANTAVNLTGGSKAVLLDLFNWIQLGPLITVVCTCVMAHEASCPRAHANDLEITKIQFISHFSLYVSKGQVLFAEFIAVVKY